MSLSKHCLTVFLLFCLLTASIGQAVMLSAAPRQQSMRTLSHTVRHRIASSLKRHLHSHTPAFPAPAQPKV